LYKKDNIIMPSIISKLVDLLKPLDIVVLHVPPPTPQPLASVRVVKLDSLSSPKVYIDKPISHGHETYL
jgi:hypothetical protein